MSATEILNIIKKIFGKYEKYAGIKTFSGDNKVICPSPSSCLTLYNYKLELTWSDGYLTEIRISGYDKNNNYRSFRKTLSWSDGYLQSVSPWEEV